MSDRSTSSDTAVLLMAYGGPNSLEDVEPYLADVTGRRLPTPFIEEIRERYRRIGGKSPLLDITNAQARALADRLSALGIAAPVFVGMRHWHPYIRDTVRAMPPYAFRRVIALCLSPYYSSMSIGAYAKKLEEAKAETAASWEWSLVESYHDHPLLWRAFAERLRAALDAYSPAERAAVTVIFSAHSLPERILQAGDPYDRQLRQTVDGVLSLIGPLSWRFAYQSQGRTPEPWLGPKVETVLEELHGAGHRHILMAPIGFIADHVEILYDVDVLFQGLAREKGMRLDRIESLNTSPLFIETLADLVRSRMKPA